jgi:hypothetical protein
MNTHRTRPAARPEFALVAAFPLAGLVAVASLGGLLGPATYARETANWTAQAIAQDWVNLVLLAPTLVVTALLALRGSRGGRLLLGGALIYATYTFFIYAFAVHFNALFLVYCAALGLAFYALAALTAGLLGEDVARWFDGRAPRRLLGWCLIVLGAVFYALWLAEDVPAIVRGTVPASTAEGGFFTNPVHVLDLALLLPAFLAGGVALLRGRPLGYALGPMVFTFNVLMGTTIAVIFLFLRARGLGGDLGLVAAFALVVVASLAVLAAFLRHLR